MNRAIASTRTHTGGGAGCHQKLELGLPAELGEHGSLQGEDGYHGGGQADRLGRREHRAVEFPVLHYIDDGYGQAVEGVGRRGVDEGARVVIPAAVQHNLR